MFLKYRFGHDSQIIRTPNQLVKPGSSVSHAKNHVCVTAKHALVVAGSRGDQLIINEKLVNISWRYPSSSLERIKLKGENFGIVEVIWLRPFSPEPFWLQVAA